MFANLEKEAWRRKDIFAQGKVTADCIVEELGDIYKKAIGTSLLPVAINISAGKAPKTQES